MNKPLKVTYAIRCARGCGKVLGYLTFPHGTPRPQGITKDYECAVECRALGWRVVDKC